MNIGKLLSDKAKIVVILMFTFGSFYFGLQYALSFINDITIPIQDRMVYTCVVVVIAISGVVMIVRELLKPQIEIKREN